MTDPNASYYLYNKAQLIRGGAEYFNLLEQLIDAASHSVYLQTYIYEADETGKRIAAALMRAAGRGIYVHLLVDGYASQNLPAAFIDDLRNKGVHFRFFEPLFKSKYFYFGRRLHHKVLVVDGRYGVVGGLNISNRYNDTPGQAAWLDWAVCVEGEVAGALYNICVSRSISPWRLTGVQIPPAPSYQLPTEVCPVRVRANDWVRAKREITRSYIEMLDLAKHQVIIMSSYFIPGRQIRRHMEKAVKRGVRIRLILAGVSDVRIAKDAERFMYRWLFKRGVEVYEYQPNVLHAKISTYDRKWVTVGSYNVNEISEKASVELNLDVFDNAFAAEVETRLVEIMTNECRRVTDEELNKEFSLGHRLLQWGAYTIIRTLLVLFTFYFKHRE
ncbi:MAG: phospholipase D-like domain-containing protein [Cyclobacteriaceae bacterium]|nr:phospholipase D-like domain-containing protein [Cyclobacteriaceae bacterium]